MEIDEFALRRISLAVSVFGVGLLFAVAELSAPVSVAVSEIDESLEGQRISTAGTVTWRRFAKNTLIFGIKDGFADITAVMFSPSMEMLDTIESGEFVRVTGKVQRYERKLEIVVERVWEMGQFD